MVLDWSCSGPVQLAKRHNDTGSRQAVSSTDLTSEFVSGFTPGFCFQAGERCERNLMQGMRSTAHKACTDGAHIFCKSECTYLVRTRFIHVIHLSVHSSVSFLWLKLAAEPDERFLFVDLWGGIPRWIACARSTTLRCQAT